ncbi:MAG: Rpn family recombination-promoting nuclease/putative transposase [Oscillochloridaceae bacterium umkhey_bin13]
MEQPASDYDGAWKYALEQFFPPFLELFFPEAFAAIDWHHPFSFRNNELQQIAPEDQVGKQRADTLVQVRRRDGTPAWIFIHIEVQSQHDSDFPMRMFRYNARLFDRERQPIVSLAVLGDDHPTWEPNDFGYGLWGCTLAFTFPTVKLLHLDAEALATMRNPFATLTLIHRDAQETRGNPVARLQRKLTRFRALLRLGYPIEDLHILLRLMEHILRVAPELQDEARATMKRIEQEETGMTTLVSDIAIISRSEGRVEGQIEERKAIVLRQLTRKLGTLDATLTDRVTALTPEGLLDLSEALLDFTAPSDLRIWLDQHAPTDAV